MMLLIDDEFCTECDMNVASSSRTQPHGRGREVLVAWFLQLTGEVTDSARDAMRLDVNFSTKGWC
jgi:hypothetical protein